MTTQAETIKLGAISAYHVRPEGKPRGGIVVVQEIFGVNPHIRSVADKFASQGYEVLAPAFFDHVERGVELGYNPEGIAQGREHVGKIGWDTPLADVRAAVETLQSAGKVGVVGYCWGGSIAYLAAARVPGLSAAVGYYGGQIAKFASEAPRVPTLLHFGDKDKGIPLSDVEQIKSAQPGVEIHVYHADHGFNCDVRASYDEPSAKQALERTLGFFEKNLG